MKETYTAVIKQSGSWWIGWIEEVPGVNCQERTKEELFETLKVTLREALELNRLEALEAAGEGFEETPIALWSEEGFFGIYGKTAVICWEKVVVIRGGTIPVKTSVRQYLGITRSMTTWPARSAKILVFLESSDPHHYLIS